MTEEDKKLIIAIARDLTRLKYWVAKMEEKMEEKMELKKMMVVRIDIQEVEAAFNKMSATNAEKN